MKTRYLTIAILIILLTAGAIACGGGKKDPVANNPTGQSPTDGPALTGRILDREGNPVGTPWASVELTNASGGNIAPSMQPAPAGPSAGMFKFNNLPVGIPLTLEIGLYQLSSGRNLGYIHTLTLTSATTFDLGDIVLENDFLANGWNAYVAKDYTLAIQNFQRAFYDRFIQADLTYSSSAYTGLGWVFAKRGKDTQSGIFMLDPDGNWLDTLNSYEWDQALINFKSATNNLNDADAWVGMAGTYLTMVGDSNKDPVLLGPWLPFYGVISYYFHDSETAIQKAMASAPDYICSHDEITVDDLHATLLFLDFIQGRAVTETAIEFLKQTGDLNEGSMQLLEILPDLINYNPYPQL